MKTIIDTSQSPREKLARQLYYTIFPKNNWHTLNGHSWMKNQFLEVADNILAGKYDLQTDDGFQHEATHTTHIFTESFHMFVADHPFVKDGEKSSELVEKISDLLGELYQEVATRNIKEF